MTDERPVPPDSLPLTSMSLLERASNRDAQAWHLIVRLYAPVIFEWCRRWGLSEGNAEDVGQDVFLSLQASLPKFRKEKPGDTFKGWLYRITYYKYVDFLTQAGRQPKAVGGDDAYAQLNQLPQATGDESDATCWENRYLYSQAVQIIQSEFNSQSIDAFLRYVVNGQPAKDVAADLGITTNVVFMAKSKILARLRSHFGELLSDQQGLNVADEELVPDGAKS